MLFQGWRLYEWLFLKDISPNPCLINYYTGDCKQVIWQFYQGLYITWKLSAKTFSGVSPSFVQHKDWFFLTWCNTVHCVHYIIITLIFNAQIVPNLACGELFQLVPMSFWHISISRWGPTCSTRCSRPIYFPSPNLKPAISPRSPGSCQ